MTVDQLQWSPDGAWSGQVQAGSRPAQLLLVFGATERLEDPALAAALAHRFPGAVRFGCSTAGEIVGTGATDAGVAVTALGFDASTVRLATTPIADLEDSRAAGRRLMEQLAADGLAHVLTLCDGLSVNGSQLAEGLASAAPDGVAITGGLAGDGTAFGHAVVMAGATVASGLAAAVGLYGAGLRVACASLGGWDPFGPERLITRSRGHVLYELDGQSALGLHALSR
ncbi:MAG: FIST N-terminal domain-containing protein [Vicinamibacterales bacterium]